MNRVSYKKSSEVIDECGELGKSFDEDGDQVRNFV